MGVAGAVQLARAPTQVVFLLVVSSLFVTPLLAQFEDEIIFNVDSTYFVLEEQPEGTAAVVLEAYYTLSSPFQLRIDGIFTLEQSQTDAQYFTIESAANADGSLTLGTLRNAVVLDRDADGVETVFSLSVTYSTPDGSLSTQNTVSKSIGLQARPKCA